MYLKRSISARTRKRRRLAMQKRTSEIKAEDVSREGDEDKVTPIARQEHSLTEQEIAVTYIHYNI